MGRIIGTPGINIEGAIWAVSGRASEIGAAAERRTGAALNRLAQTTGATVLHGLVFGRGKTSFDVDHAVVTGTDVYLVDSKCWRPGAYYNLGSRVYRGFLNRFQYAEVRTHDAAVERLAKHGILVAGSVMAVWPSREDGRVTMLRVRNPSAKVMSGDRAMAWLARRIDKPADVATVDVLASFVPKASR